MKEPFIFYRALDPLRGSWDGYGYIPLGESDFLVYVSDAPVAASIQTPEIIRSFWIEHLRSGKRFSQTVDLAIVELADGINRLQDTLQKRSRAEGAVYQATLCLGWKRGTHLLYGSIGDSILQLLRYDRLYRLTNSEIWDSGLIADVSHKLVERRRARPLQFIGEGGDFFDPSQIRVCELLPDDILVFTTDGAEDLLPPDRLIPLLTNRPEKLRSEMESIFSQEKLKDDVTILSVPVTLPQQFNPEKEVTALRTHLESLQKEQARFRNDLTQSAIPSARLEKLERSLQQLSDQIQSIGRKLDAVRETRGTQSLHVTAKPRSKRYMWVWISGAFALGFLLAILIWNRVLEVPESPRTLQITRPRPAPQQRVSPPEIPAAGPCSYTVVKGDTLEKIAATKQTTVDAILQLNPGLQKNTLQAGQEILICKNAL